MRKLSVLTQETDLEMDRYMEKRLKTVCRLLVEKRKLLTHTIYSTQNKQMVLVTSSKVWQLAGFGEELEADFTMDSLSVPLGFEPC